MVDTTGGRPSSTESFRGSWTDVLSDTFYISPSTMFYLSGRRCSARGVIKSIPGVRSFKSVPRSRTLARILLCVALAPVVCGVVAATMLFPGRGVPRWVTRWILPAGRVLLNLPYIVYTYHKLRGRASLVRASPLPEEK